MRTRIILFFLCAFLILALAGILGPSPAQTQIIETVDHAILADVPPVVLPILTP